MENLTEVQQRIIRQGINFKKFSAIAEEAKCSLDGVKQFATIVFAEQKAATDGQLARERADKEYFLKSAKELLADDDFEALRELWQDECVDEIANEVLEQNYEVRNDIAKDFLEEHEQEIDAQFQEAMREEISDATDEAFQEFLEELKA